MEYRTLFRFEELSEDVLPMAWGGEGDTGDRASDSKQLLITLLFWYMLWLKEAIPLR